MAISFNPGNQALTDAAMSAVQGYSQYNDGLQAVADAIYKESQESAMESQVKKAGHDMAMKIINNISA